ncbi:MAG: hypothetical protein [Podoviridae sp. ctLUJ1]|nr:MAG: hypothetical protein [Podoviridae sp. ctLUJ1]
MLNALCEGLDYGVIENLIINSLGVNRYHAVSKNPTLKKRFKMDTITPRTFAQFILKLPQGNIFASILTMPAFQDAEYVLGKERALLEIFYVVIASCAETNNLEVCFDKPLKDAFPWAQSPQGFDFWNCVYMLVKATIRLTDDALLLSETTREMQEFLKKDTVFKALFVSKQKTYAFQTYLFNFDSDMDNCMFIQKRTKDTLHFALESNPNEEWTLLNMKEGNLVTSVLPRIAHIHKEHLNWEEIYSRYGFTIPSFERGAKWPIEGNAKDCVGKWVAKPNNTTIGATANVPAESLVDKADNLSYEVTEVGNPEAELWRRNCLPL